MPDPDAVEFSVLLPGDSAGPDTGTADPAPTAKPTLPTIGVSVELVPGYPYQIRLSDEDTVTKALDFCYQVGGMDLVARLYQAIPAPFTDTRAVADSFLKQLREDVTGALEDVDWQMRTVFLENLNQAQAVTRLSAFGFIDAPPEGTRTPVLADYVIYKSLRQAVVDLDGTARVILEFNERQQSPSAEAQHAFELAWQQATTNFPGLLDPGADLIAKTTRRFTADEMADYANTEGEYRNPLDMLIRNAVWQNWHDVWNAGPRLSDEYLAASEKACSEAWTSPLPPSYTHAELSPMWQIPTIVHSALYRMGAGPGSVEYAAATETIRAAAARKRFEDKRDASLVNTLNWAALGFGTASMVPVIGPFALAASIACAGALSFYYHSQYDKAKLQRDALGPLAAAYGFADPDGSGLLLAEFSADFNLGMQAFGALAGLAGKMLRFTKWQQDLQITSEWPVTSLNDYFTEVFDAEMRRTNLLRSPLDVP
jgi:hypothetical protein